MKKFLAKVIGWIKVNIFGALSDSDKLLLQRVAVVVNNIKTLVYNPNIDVYTQIIPGNWDDKAVADFRSYIDKAAAELTADAPCAAVADEGQKILCVIQQLAGKTVLGKKGFIQSLAVCLLHIASDGKLDWSDAVYAMQFWYDFEFSKQK